VFVNTSLLYANFVLAAVYAISPGGIVPFYPAIYLLIAANVLFYALPVVLMLQYPEVTGGVGLPVHSITNVHIAWSWDSVQVHSDTIHRLWIKWGGLALITPFILSDAQHRFRGTAPEAAEITGAALQAVPILQKYVVTALTGITLFLAFAVPLIFFVGHRWKQQYRKCISEI
jgi:hypothetical protein